MTITAEFYAPSQLNNAQPSYQRLLTELHSKIGNEQLCSRLEAISYEWALESGYYLKIIRDRYLFIHVTLNPRDFN
jgi:hypothetical protein